MSATPTISKISPENFHKPFTVIGLGEILIDQFPDFERIGGAPANALYHLHNLGLRTELLSAIGDDDSGAKILRWLEQQQLSREFISADPSHPTGTVTVTPTQTGSHRFVITQEVAWDYIAFYRGPNRSSRRRMLSSMARSHSAVLDPGKPCYNISRKQQPDACACLI